MSGNQQQADGDEQPVSPALRHKLHEQIAQHGYEQKYTPLPPIHSGDVIAPITPAPLPDAAWQPQTLRTGETPVPLPAIQLPESSPMAVVPASTTLSSLSTHPFRGGTLVLNRLQPSDAIAAALRVQRHRKLVLRHFSRKHMRQSRQEVRHAAHRLWLTIGTTALLFLLLFLSLTGAGAYAGYRFYSDTQQKYIPRILALPDLLPKDNLKVFDRKGIIIGQLTDQGIHTTVALTNVSLQLVNATIATEDKNFWTNQGVDLFRILRAALDDLRSGRVVEGGSTITQQLIKNLVVGNETTIERKLAEIMLTPDINSRYTKHDILQMYLNSIYYGEQAYGIDAAATVYFGLEDQPGQPASQQLDIAQAAMLAGIPSSPDAYDPLKHPQAAYNRFLPVLDLMLNQGYITKVQELDAIKEAQDAHFFKTAPSLTNRAPHFFNFVLTQLEQMFHLKRNELSRSDMIVTTTLDIALQDKIQKIAQSHIADLRDAHNLHNAAEVLIDFHTGAIISLLGSLDYNDKSIDGQFDVATQGYRQPGSSFKPYVYVTAFKQGASPAQAIDDKPLTIDLPYSDPPTFTPLNYDRRFHGHMTLRCALQNSLNVPAVKVLQHVGIDAAMQTAQDMGISSYEGTPGYSLVLGGLGVRLIDHASAYGTFANGGVHVPYYAVEKVKFASTGQTYGHALNNGKHVLSPQLAYMMTSVLSDNSSRTPEFYDCNVLQLYANSQADCWYGNRGTVRPAAVKTGTTNDFRDNWTVGYTTDYVMGVWAGNDDNTPMIDVTGVQGAAPIWHDAMLLAEQGKPLRDFVNSGGLNWQQVTYPDGIQTSDWFMPGTAPVFATPTPSPITGTPVASPTPGNGKPVAPTKPVVVPYCPSSYSFVSQPPADSVPSPIPGWW